MDLTTQFPKATPQHRLAGYALDLGLMIVTCGIGWFIWSLVVWAQGQTPGKQILKMRVVASKTGAQATWGHMAIRQFLFPFALWIIYYVLVLLVGGSSTLLNPDYWANLYFSYAYFASIAGAGILSVFVSILYYAVQITDAFWILRKSESRRITDILASTNVLNIAAPRATYSA